MAGRDNALQGAADNVVLTKLLQSGVELPGDRLGGTVPTVVFYGLQPFRERLQLRKVTLVECAGTVIVTGKGRP